MGFPYQQPEYSKAGQIPRLNAVLLLPLPVCVYIYFFLKIHNFCRLLHDSLCEFSLCMLHCFGLNLTKVGFFRFTFSSHLFPPPPFTCRAFYFVLFRLFVFFAGSEIRILPSLKL